jgi:hypothetical protein
MLEEGKKAAAQTGITNVTFRKGSAYDLEADGTYDAAMCRFAFHHLKKPREALAQMVKAAGSGPVIVIDLVSPEDAGLAEINTRFERLRDYSHVRALSAGEFETMFREMGLSDIRTERLDVANGLEAWMEMSDTPQDSRREIREALKAELAGGPETGFRPFMENGNIKFRYAWAMFTGWKVMITAQTGHIS